MNNKCLLFRGHLLFPENAICRKGDSTDLVFQLFSLYLMMHKFFLISLLFIIGCDLKSNESDTLPDIQTLDSIADKNPDLLYYWTEESFENEKSIPNNRDLDIKLNRKVTFSFKGNNYILYPFFRKTHTNKKILRLHFLLTKGNLKPGELTAVSFKNLGKLNAKKAYYSYKTE